MKWREWPMKSIKRRNKNIKTKNFYWNLSYKFLIAFIINFPEASLGLHDPCMICCLCILCQSYWPKLNVSGIRQHSYLRLVLHSISPSWKVTAPPFGLACHFLGMWSLFRTSKKVLLSCCLSQPILYSLFTLTTICSYFPILISFTPCEHVNSIRESAVSVPFVTIFAASST